MPMRFAVFLPVALVAAALVAGRASAASLRPMADVAGPLVRLSDLFDDCGAAGARVLGPAPRPGGRITVGAAQLSAIAQAYGVDWRATSDADQAVLERPGAVLPEDQLLDALRPALVAQGAGGDFDIALPFFEPPMLAAGMVPRLSIAQLSYDAASGRFAALVMVDDGTGEPLPLRLAGTVAASVQVLVPARRLLAGGLIVAGDLVAHRVRASQVNDPVVVDASQALGLQLRHMEFPGQPVPLADLQHPAAIAKGDRIMMSLALPGLDLGAVGQALAGGAEGDTIAVRNPVSGAVLSALIVGRDQVRVDAEAPPALPLDAQNFAQR